MLAQLLGQLGVFLYTHLMPRRATACWNAMFTPYMAGTSPMISIASLNGVLPLGSSQLRL
jgi:hypothetical protein